MLFNTLLSSYDHLTEEVKADGFAVSWFVAFFSVCDTFGRLM